MVSTAVFDTLAALLLLAVAVLGAYAPVLLYNWGKKDGIAQSRSLAYVLGNMLSAGVMISAGFVHLLGSAVQELNPGALFPLAPFLCGLGFILTLLADHIAERLSSRSGWDVSACHSHATSSRTLLATNSLDRDGSLLQRVVVDEEQGDRETVPTEERLESSNPHRNGKHAFEVEGVPMANGNSSSMHENGGHTEVEGLPDAASPRNRNPADTRAGLKYLRETAKLDREPLVGAAVPRSDTPCDTSPGLEVDYAETNGPTQQQALAIKVPDMKQVSFITAVLMAVALCFHSVLEGMAMGAQPSIVDSLHIFIAIFAHKGLAAYALGSSIVDSGASKQRFWAVVAAFALATPVGILFGRIVASVSETGVAAALSALASGTFLYVAFMEVIPKEMQTHEHGLSKLGMLCLGFGAMSLLAIWA